MRILIADDDRISRFILQRALTNWGHELVVVEDGLEAWRALQGDEAPKLAILDWMMPGLDGAEVCRRVRADECSEPPYLILLTARHQKEDIVAGLDSGANDFVVKPFDPRELQARVRVAQRVVELQYSVAARVRELETTLAEVKRLKGLLPICCYCKKIRDDGDYWQQVETYLESNTDVQFSHGICPTCYETALAEVTSLGPA